MSGADGPSPAEHHLGDRLAALIDGELGHEARDRVLAHLVTCLSCRAEADAQRRVKSVFSGIAPPAPSDGLLARLQGLPACGDDDRGGTGAGRPVSAREVHGAGDLPDPRSVRDLRVMGGGPAVGSVRGPHEVRRVRRGRRTFAVPALGPDRASGRTSGTAAGRTSASPGEQDRPSPGGVLAQGGLRIHEADRAGSRGRRFAFAAAGAFSLAALALGGALASQAARDVAVTPAQGSGTAASPVRSDVAGAGSRGRAPDEVQERTGAGAGWVYDASFGALSGRAPGLQPPQAPYLSPPFSAALVVTPLLLPPSASTGGGNSTAPGASPSFARPGTSPSASPRVGIQPLTGRASDPAAPGVTRKP